MGAAGDPAVCDGRPRMPAGDGQPRMPANGQPRMPAGDRQPGCPRRSTAGALPWVLQRSSVDVPGHRLAGLSLTSIGDSGAGSFRLTFSGSFASSVHLANGGQSLERLLRSCTTSCGVTYFPSFHTASARNQLPDLSHVCRGWEMCLDVGTGLG